MKKVLCLAAALLAVSCIFEDEPTTPPAYPEATSPANCLKCIEVSFTQRNAGLLDDMLSKAFVFHFDPDDVGRQSSGGYFIPETWSYAEFTGAVTNLYRKAFSVSLTIPTVRVGEPDPNETTYDAKNINIKLLVMIDELNGYIADTGYCNYRFERYDGEGGKKFWRLTQWWDNTATSYDANTGVAPTSLGRVLAIFN